MKVLLTGATGFLGGHTARLLLQRGHAVRALVRDSSDTSALDALGVPSERACLDTPRGLERALDGIDAVVHAAGGGQGPSIDAVYVQNRDTTLHLLDAAARHAPGLSRFVLVSSLAAAGPSADGQPVPPHTAPAPISHYGRAKAAAEAGALQAADTLPVTILRPPAVYGPGDTRMLGLFRAACRRLLPVLGRGHTASIIHVDDAALAIALALEAPSGSGAIYGLADGPPHTVRDLGRAVARALDRRALPIPIPTALLPPAALVSRALSRLSGRPVFLSPDKVGELSQRHWVSETETIKGDLGFSPQVPLDEGMRATATWYRQHGWL